MPSGLSWIYDTISVRRRFQIDGKRFVQMTFIGSTEKNINNYADANFRDYKLQDRNITLTNPDAQLHQGGYRDEEWNDWLFEWKCHVLDTRKEI